MADEYPCCRCGEWFPPSSLIPYTRGRQRDLSGEGDADRIPVTETFAYCPECDREVQRQLRDAMVQAGFDPDQNKERFFDREGDDAA